jgi:hypothetical protein
MNERIKKIVEQTTQEFSPAFEIDKWQEKFSELIVRECVEVMRLVPYDTDREFGDEIIYQDAVKKHFGVE